MTALARSHSRRAARASRRVGVVHKVPRFRLLRRLSLRARVTLTFALGGLLMSALLAGATLYLTRQNLLQKREAAALDEVFDNAQQANGYLKDDPINDIDLIVDNLKSPNDFIVRYLERESLLPGFVEGYSRIHHDEQRHIGYGTWFLREAVREAPELADNVRATLRALLPAVSQALAPPDREGTDWDALGASSEEIRDFAVSGLSRRLNIVGVPLDSL